MLINLLATAGQELFEQFDLTTIVLILLLAFFLVLEVSQGIDYFRKKNKNKNDEYQDKEKRITNLEILEHNSENTIQKIKNDLDEVKKNINLLIISDKDDIRSWITDKYHYFINLGYIDDFSLDCLERRFKSYKQEGGNTYVDSMMEELRALPRKNRLDK